MLKHQGRVILNNYQSEMFNKFLVSAIKGENRLESSQDRQIGKTTIMIEVTKTLRDLGFDIKIYSKYPLNLQSNLINKRDMINLSNYGGKLSELKHCKTILVIDEASFIEMYNSGLYEFAKKCGLPLIGYCGFY